MNPKRENRYQLFQNCLPVKGYLRSIIVDFHREESHYIPNQLFDFLTSHKVFTIDDLAKNIGYEYAMEYFSFLKREELIFICNSNNQNNFPKINLSYYFPFKLENAIIDLYKLSNYNLRDVFEELTEINCRNIQIRDFDGENTYKIYENLDVFEKSSVVRIEIITKHKADNIDLLLRMNNNLRVISIIETAHPKGNKQIKLNRKGIYFTNQEVLTESSCGYITHGCLNTHQRTIMKTINFNSCLYKKIGIDKDGYIKNCPAMVNNFGHIDTKTISEAIQSKGFTRMGLINKDQINVCKDCEFRYNCSDCRAFVKGEFDVPTKCEYNPYICKWKGEDGYLTLEECGVVSSNNEFEIDHDKIKQINTSLWQE